VKMWDASTGACLHAFEGHSSGVSSVSFSHDSKRLASASWDSTVKIWDASTGACLQTLEGHSHWVNSVAFSHDSKRLVSASHDNTVKMWDASTGACLQTLEGHSSFVLSVAFSHDSKRLASVSSDRTVRLWDTGSGACLQTLNVGKRLPSFSIDATISSLLTEIGYIDASLPVVFDTKNFAELLRPLYVDVGVSLDGTWITCSGKKLLWIPSEYRPSCLSVCGETIGIGTGSGRAWICDLNIEMFS
jgi:WD40 repeat protein